MRGEGGERTAGEHLAMAGIWEGQGEGREGRKGERRWTGGREGERMHRR